jgi:uncharacterized membrane protein YbhN (UPF0104 family)
VVGVLAIAAVIHFVVPRLSALGRTVHRLRGADTKWLGLGVVLEALSLGGYIALFRTVFSCHGARIGWKTSLRRLRRDSRRGRRRFAHRALRRRRAVDADRRSRGRWRHRQGGARRGQRLRARLTSAPWAVHDALGIAFSLMKERKPGLIGAIAYWGFDIATLWTCFHAFGTPPPVAVIVMAYVVGVLANALPLPGGLGGVEGGMIGAFLAFGTPSSLAILAVLSDRLISFWLPTVPGAAASLQLRHTVGHWRDETQRQPVTSPVPWEPA